MAEKDLRNDAIAEENQDHSTKELGECVTAVGPDFVPCQRRFGYGGFDPQSEVMDRWCIFTSQRQRSRPAILACGDCNLFMRSSRHGISGDSIPRTYEDK